MLLCFLWGFSQPCPWLLLPRSICSSAVFKQFISYFFTIQYIVPCIQLFFEPIFLEYSNFLLCKYASMLMPFYIQQILHDLCYLIFMHIVCNDKFTHNFLRCISIFFSICTNPPLSSLQQAESVSKETGQSNHGPICTHPWGSRSPSVFCFDAIEQHLVGGCAITKENEFVFVDHVDSTACLLYPVDESFVHVSIPLQKIVPFLPVKMLLKIAKLHHIPIGTHVPKSQIIQSFDAHSCASCDVYHSIFAVLDSKSLRAKNRMRALWLNLNKLPDHDAQIFSGKHCDDKLDTKGEVSFALDPMMEPVEYRLLR